MAEIAGTRFGSLVAIERCAERTADRRVQWVCQCDCGRRSIVPTKRLLTGNTKSCGCGKTPLRHGHSVRGKRSSEYQAWYCMLSRCYDVKHPSYHNYGGSGIAVCATWRADFAAFLAHIGLKPTPLHTVDRIDNARGYEPGNVRWATRKEQAANRRPARRRIA